MASKSERTGTTFATPIDTVGCACVRSKALHAEDESLRSCLECTVIGPLQLAAMKAISAELASEFWRSAMTKIRTIVF